MLKLNRYLLHGQNTKISAALHRQNSTKEITAVAQTKQHDEDNCCFTDKNNTKKWKKIPA